MHVYIGELIGKQVNLSGHDIDEILQEQSCTGRRFGEIALSWGLCQPQHIWRAWATQCADRETRVDLTRVPVDYQAVALLSHDTASRLGMVPLRSFDDEVIIAATADLQSDQKEEVGRILQKRCRFVTADARQIRDAIAAYYHPAQSA
jgi:hypothetical protein